MNIVLGKSGMFAIIDPEDWDIIKDYKWYLFKSSSRWRTFNYALGYRTVDKEHEQIFMHRLLTSCPPGLVVDHINSNGLDNRQSNIRITTYAGNGYNKRPINPLDERLKANKL